MNKFIVALSVVLLAACGQQSADQTGAEVRLDSEQAKLSYGIGMDIGMSLKTLDIELDRAAMFAAISDLLGDKELQLSHEEAIEIKQAFFKQQAEEAAAERKALGEKNSKEGAAFLAEHAKKEGVTVTESGLHYQVIRKGEGIKPTLDDQVRVHYKGTLIDGTEFDSSYGRGEPISFPLAGVIPGWQEGVQLMSVGSKYRFVVPSDLGYGESGAGNTIGPNSVLIFEVELLDIIDEKASDSDK